MLISAWESNFQSTGTIRRSYSTTAFLTSRSGATENASVIWALADLNSNLAVLRVSETDGVMVTRSPARFANACKRGRANSTIFV